MNPLEKSLALLQKYLKETPKHVVQEKIDKFNQAHFEGVTVHEYFQLFEQHYWFVSPTIADAIFMPTIEHSWTCPTEKIDGVTTSWVKDLMDKQDFNNHNYAIAA